MITSQLRSHGFKFASALRSEAMWRKPLQSSSLGNAMISRMIVAAAATSSSSSLSSQAATAAIPRWFSSSSSSSSPSVDLSDRELMFHQAGILDERGLTIFDTLHEMQVRSCQVYADNELFGTHNGKQYEWMTFQDYARNVDKCRALLLDLGVGPYGKVGIISNNRWEWATIAAAAYSIKAALVPMYEAQLPSDWTYIVNDSACSVLFCATPDIFQRVQKEVLPSTPLVHASVCLDGPEGEPYAFSTLLSSHAAAVGDTSHIKPPTPEDLANLIYTSGTTGKPKGVELTHLNFTSNIKAAARSMVENPREFVREDDRSLAFLPWAHSYGQTCELWMSISHGASMGVCRGVPHILEDLQMVKPSVLFAVPTLYKKVYDGVHNMMESSSPLKKKLMRRALELGRANVEIQHDLRKEMSWKEMLEYKVLDTIILSKIRSRFGGKLRHGFVAGAACPAEVLEFMDSIGIPICEGYGLTETSPIITINTPEQRKVGSVGKAIGGVKVYIVDEEGRQVPTGEEGEICCVGPNVMKGYYRNKEATDEVISTAPDGKSRMFHTGDLGRMDEEGFVKVTGRLKEQYKLENGKYVVPTPIEEAIGMSRFISQVVLCGANRPHNIALLVPEWNAIRTELGVGPDAKEEDLANDPRVTQLMDDEIKSSCYKLKKFEVPTKWAFVAPFTAANNMLTPKMSIRRHKVIQTYHELIGHLYGDEPATVTASESSSSSSSSHDGLLHKDQVQAAAA